MSRRNSISAIYIIERPSSLLKYNENFLKGKKTLYQILFVSDGV
jgi:hypothetical protein